MCCHWLKGFGKDSKWVEMIPDGLVVRIRRFHRRGRGSIPRLGEGGILDGVNVGVSMALLGSVERMRVQIRDGCGIEHEKCSLDLHYWQSSGIDLKKCFHVLQGSKCAV